MKKIILPTADPEFILAQNAGDKISDSGIILVYEKENIIGSVIYRDELFIISTKDTQDEYISLESIIEEFPNYTFMYSK